MVEAIESHPATRESTSRRIARFQALAALAGYAVLTIIVFWQDLPYLDKTILADEFDGLANWWNLWWVRTALTQLQSSPFHTDLLWYPHGTPLYLDATTPINGLFAMALAPVLGDTLAYNAVILVSYLLAGWFFFLFVRRYSPYWGIAFTGGVLFTLSPYHISHTLGHMNFVTIQFVPLFLAAFRQGLETGRLRWAIASNILLLATALSDWFYFISSLVFAGFLFMEQLVKAWPAIREWRFPVVLSQFIFYFLSSAALVVAPLWLAAMFEFLNHPYSPGHPPKDFSADLLLYFVPGACSAWGDLSRNIWSQFGGNMAENAGWIGMITIAGVILALVLRASSAITWMIAAAFFFLLSLGPELQVAGEMTSLVMPYGWLEGVFPLVRITGTPVRFYFGAQFALVVAACIGYQRFMERLPDRQRLMFTVILILVATAEFWPAPFLRSDVRLSEEERSALLAIRDEPGEFAVLTAPTWDNLWHKYLQTFHHRPIIGGFTSRWRLEYTVELEKTPILPVLYGYRDLEAIDFPLEANRAALRACGVRFVISLKPEFDELSRKIGLPLEFAGERFRIYRVPD